MFVAEAHAAGEALNVDALLVLAVMRVESSLDPAARSRFGARGLMQSCPTFIATSSPSTAARAQSTILGSTCCRHAILKDYLRQTGSLHAGLQRYAGWQYDEAKRYARKVISEKERLSRVVQSAIRKPQPEGRSS